MKSGVIRNARELAKMTADLYFKVEVPQLLGKTRACKDDWFVVVQCLDMNPRSSLQAP